jgi:hypothetical protein
MPTDLSPFNFPRRINFFYQVFFLMVKTACLSIYLFLPFISVAQVNNANTSGDKLTPVINTITHKIGDSNTSIQTFQYGDKKDIVFISLHDNEFTGLEPTKLLLEGLGGLLIKIENDNNRNINFRLDQRSYTFDPNRMFSKIGIQKTLQSFGRSNDKAVNEVDKFAKRILRLFPKDFTCAFALHDNTDGGYSVKYYQPGSQYGNDARLVSIDTLQDPDDFFLTTDSLFFHRLSAKKYNVILQHNQRAKQDGSLSVYFGMKKIRYLNCETQQGKTGQYKEMMETAIQCLNEMED